MVLYQCDYAIAMRLSPASVVMGITTNGHVSVLLDDVDWSPAVSLMNNAVIALPCAGVCSVCYGVCHYRNSHHANVRRRRPYVRHRNIAVVIDRCLNYISAFETYRHTTSRHAARHAATPRHDNTGHHYASAHNSRITYATIR